MEGMEITHLYYLYFIRDKIFNLFIFVICFRLKQAQPQQTVPQRNITVNINPAGKLNKRFIHTLD